MSNLMLGQLASATGQTLEMVLIATLIAVLGGLPLGVLLFVTREQGVLEGVQIHRVVGFIVNAVRSIPFIILMVAITPFTRFVVGTSIGTVAAIVPLSVAAIPFLARLVENALKEIPFGVIEAAQAMGANTKQIIYKVLLPEALPAVIRAITLTLITLVGYSAMAGAVGGGGLGDLGIRYGYQRFELGVMVATVVVLIVLVQFLQMLGDWLAVKLRHRH